MDGVLPARGLWRLVQHLGCARQGVETGDDRRFEVDGGRRIVSGADLRSAGKPVLGTPEQCSHAAQIGRIGEDRGKVTGEVGAATE